MSVASSTTATSNTRPQAGDATDSLDLSNLPPIFALSAHLDSHELHTLEDDVAQHNGHLTYDAHEAQIFVGKIAQKRRAALELRSIGIHTVETRQDTGLENEDATGQPLRKRRRVGTTRSKPMHANATDSDSDSTTESEHYHDAVDHVTQTSTSFTSLSLARPESDFHVAEGTVIVVGLEWLKDSVSSGGVQPFSAYKIYHGQKVGSHPDVDDSLSLSPARPSTATSNSPMSPTKGATGADILARAQEELGSDPSPVTKAFSSTTQSARFKNRNRRSHTTKPAKLIRQTTSDLDSDRLAELPEMPDWVKRRSTYSCERSTPTPSANEEFIDALKKIRLARTLTGDEIGVRAYSTSIAAIAAYPHTIKDEREVLRLPGCDSKIAALWREWDSSDGHVQAAYDAENDEQMQVLRQFYDVWGVGATTAREFYARGWRDLDDLIEHGWDALSRVQQIGVKYFDEFQRGIPRAEVEAIAATVAEHARRVREPTGIHCTIVGGYRRGKEVSGDVDVVVTHTDESQTLYIVQDIVASLVDAGWVTHELSTSLQGTRRGQSTLPFRRGGGGHGFDTLDKALVVWQDPNWPGKDEAPEGTKNPNVHRRVDIIIAPWSKIGCALLGWSAGMTFERDLRRYSRHKKGWKFDSSGIRDRMSGYEVDLEGVGGVCETPEEAEKKVFAGLGLVYREPWERCTG